MNEWKLILNEEADAYLKELTKILPGPGTKQSKFRNPAYVLTSLLDRHLEKGHMWVLTPNAQRPKSHPSKQHARGLLGYWPRSRANVAMLQFG